MGPSRTSSQAQFYDYIKSLDPYHITTGAVNCGTSWTWSDVPSLEKPTSDLGDAVIAVGQQPLLQLSIDYILHENYGRRFSDHQCDGFWSQCLGGDGELRKGVSFEPVVNCLGRNSYGTAKSGGAAEDKFASLAYLGVVEAGMIDQVTFADPIRSENTAAAKIAREFLELRPSLQGEFGKHFSLTATVEVVNGSCHASDAATPEHLRAKVWQEESESGVCAHLVVINLNAAAPAQFRVTLTGTNTTSSVAERMWALGANLHIDAQGQLDSDWLAPGGHNVYRIGCSSPPPATGNIIPSWEDSRDFTGGTITGSLNAGQSADGAGFQPNPNGYARPVNPLSNVFMQADTTVRLPTARHSIRISVPTGTPYVFALPGPAVAKRVQKRPEDSKCCLAEPALNCDLTGSPLATLPTDNATACAAACCANGQNCSGYGWVPHPPTAHHGPWCAPPPPPPPPFNPTDWHMLPGHNGSECSATHGSGRLKSLWEGYSTPNACLQRCASNSDCRFATVEFFPKTRPGGGYCVLHHSCPAMTGW